MWMITFFIKLPLDIPLGGAKVVCQLYSKTVKKTIFMVFTPVCQEPVGILFFLAAVGGVRKI